MRVLAIDPEPFDALPALNATGRGGVEQVSFPLLRGRVDALPDGLEALVLAADLQALELPGDRPSRLIGLALVERLLELAQAGALPPPERTGVILAGDLYTVPDLAKRGGLGDVREVWGAFAGAFRWAAGVLGNHDGLGTPGEEARFRTRGPAHLLEGEVRELDGLRLGGLGGIVGNPLRPRRREVSDFCDVLETVLLQEPDLLVLHEGPDALAPDGARWLRGNGDLRAVLEAAGLPRPPLVVCGHSCWPVPLATLQGQVQVLKVDARVVVLQP